MAIISITFPLLYLYQDVNDLLDRSVREIVQNWTEQLQEQFTVLRELEEQLYQRLLGFFLPEDVEEEEDDEEEDEEKEKEEEFLETETEEEYDESEASTEKPKDPKEVYIQICFKCIYSIL